MPTSSENAAQPAVRSEVHVARIPVRWGDMDIQRHVNNVVYFRYFEQARIEWFDDVVKRDTRAGQGIVVANAYCNFLRPIVYPETVEVVVYSGPPGRSSFTISYDLFRAGDRSIRYADGYTVAVWVDRATGRSLPLPEDVRGHLAPPAGP